MRRRTTALLGLALLLLGSASARNLQQAGNQFVPAGGKGSWKSDIKTADIYLIHNNLMKDGSTIGWSTVSGQYGYGTAQCNLARGGGCQRILGKQGIAGGKNVFCSGQVTTADNHLVAFGGHSGDIEWLRHYDANTGKLAPPLKIGSGRWYPGACTLPDGNLIMVAGVAKSGCANWKVDLKKCGIANNPTYEIYNPKTRRLGGDQQQMRAQLSEAFPMSTYPTVAVTPDGSLAVAAKKSLVRYVRTGEWTVAKASEWPDRPGAPWAYPNTGQGMLLPMSEPWNQLTLISTGGSVIEAANDGTPASDAAWVINLANPAAKWRSVGPMPIERVMGDAVTLCDGTIMFLNGAGTGVAGWSSKPVTYRFPDGTTYACKSKCSKADRDGKWAHQEPVIFDPETEKWSRPGTLAKAAHPRLYHSSALLLPTCQVMVGGSDVTNDKTAEIFTPPHLAIGPRPAILDVNDNVLPGAKLRVRYQSADKVVKALLLRTGATTHSMAFDARSAWLPVESDDGATVVLRTPPSSTQIPPGMYMVVLHTEAGAVSNGHIISIRSNWSVAKRGPAPVRRG